MMQHRASYYLATLPDFLLFFAVGLVLTGLFVVIYTWITPHREFALIRAGNSAAAMAFAGAVLGFELPLASAISHSVNVYDMALWGAIALVMQILAFLCARLFYGSLSADIVAGKNASALFVATFSVGVGILNAACITY